MSDAYDDSDTSPTTQLRAVALASLAIFLARSDSNHTSVPINLSDSRYTNDT